MLRYRLKTALFVCVLASLVSAWHGTNALNGDWGPWTKWNRHCIASCGDPSEGFRYRNRDCDSPAPSTGGTPCNGPAMERKFDHCHLRPCPDGPVSGGWSSWTPWRLTCSATCGAEVSGKRRRVRFCNNPPAANGGAQCMGDDTEVDHDHVCRLRRCPGNETTLPPTTPPVDGTWGSWTSWERKCAAKCGDLVGGFRYRTRGCDSPGPSPGGKPCAGPDRQEVGDVCRVRPCPVNGDWGPWTKWNRHCIASCGDPSEGFRYRNRDCDSPAPSTGGTPCNGPAMERKFDHCHLRPCPDPTTTEPPTTTADCDEGNTKVESCHVYVCNGGRWEMFEFTANRQCCEHQKFHPRCHMFFPDPTTTESPPSTTAVCDEGDPKVESCYLYVCYGGRWEMFEFTASRQCCEDQKKYSDQFHPRCHMFFPDPTTTEPPTTTADCDEGDTMVESCHVHVCHGGRWEMFEFTASRQCCEDQKNNFEPIHPKCHQMLPGVF